MNWIKNRYDQLILAGVAVALLLFAGMVVVKTGSLPHQLSEAVADGPPGAVGVVAAEDAFVVSTISAATSPVWTTATRFDNGERGSLFAPRNPPGPPICVGPPTDSLTGKFIDLRWFAEHNVSISKETVRFDALLLQDPDEDGFLNEDEWREGTDPVNPDSHPPYYTKLFLKRVVRTPFRLIFSAYDGDSKKPESMEFQINTIDLRQPSAFLKIGEVIPNTGLRVTRFEPKESKGLEPGDISELTLSREATNESFTLMISEVMDVPIRHVIFDYQWPGAAGEFPVKEGGQFGLRPEKDRNLLYQVSEITDTEVVIRLPNGQRYTVHPDPRKAKSITPKPPQP